MSEQHNVHFVGKVALVTGGTSGIGHATAITLAATGCRVAVVGRDAFRGTSIVDKICRNGGEAIFVNADMRRADDISNMITQVLDRYGQIDIAFNNAGHVESPARLTDKTPDEYEAVFDTNVRAVFLCMQGEIAAMRSNGGGIIINNASISSIRNAVHGIALYAASKAAVVSLTKTAAVECAEEGIRINAISPGRVETPLLINVGQVTNPDRGGFAAGLPMKRLGTPSEVASAVLWLASPASSFVVGHNLCVDGGFLAQ
jgi:NAD(P)-dependent dehydrogenase (short-subunit alcohol dehydrogenase family)